MTLDDTFKAYSFHFIDYRARAFKMKHKDPNAYAEKMIVLQGCTASMAATIKQATIDFVAKCN